MTTAALLAQERYWNDLAAEQIRRERLVKAERLNGRLAMIGFSAFLLELISGHGPLHAVGLL